jgi:hypothetical protein
MLTLSIAKSLTNYQVGERAVAHRAIITDTREAEIHANPALLYT